jgi:glycosyltransferase involved in cell wall biosynthesis
MTDGRRLAFLIGNGSGTGGAERRLAEVLPLLRSEGARATVLCPAPDAPRPLRDSCGVAEVLTSVDTRRFIQWVAKAEPDAVFVFGHRAAALAGLARVLMPRRMPRFIVMQTGLDYRRNSRTYGWIIRRRSLVRLVLANSISAVDHVLEAFRVPADRVALLPSAVGARWLEPIPESRLGSAELTVAIVGSSRQEKNLAPMMEALADVARNMPIRTVIYSDNCSIHRELVERCEVTGSVSFIEGRQLEPTDYREIDILLHASVSESMSRSIIEALSQGCAVVASSCPELAELGRPSLLLDGHDASDIARGLANAAEYVAAVLPERRRSEPFPWPSADFYASELLRLVDSKQK